MPAMKDSLPSTEAGRLGKHPQTGGYPDPHNHGFGLYHIASMKYLLSSPDPARIGLAQSLLDAAGIEWEVRNEAVSQTAIGMPFATELWVLRDDDYQAARDLLKSGAARA